MTTGKHSFKLFRIVSSRSILLITSTEIRIGRGRDGLWTGVGTGVGRGRRKFYKMRKIMPMDLKLP